MRLKRGAIRIIALGGLGEVGLNCMVIEDDHDAFLIDAGLMFPFDPSPGFEYLIPDFSYLANIRKKIRALIVTHGHEDHIGAIPYLAPWFKGDIFGSRFTLALLKERLEKTKKNPFSLRHLPRQQPLKLGNFQISLIPTSHSIPGARSVWIETPHGNILHTGDFKIDPTTSKESQFDPKTFGDLGKKGVDVLLSDSTNALTPGHATRENEVAEKLLHIFQQTPGRIFVGVFSSHIQRIQQVMDAAVTSGRKVLILGKSLLRNVDVAQKLGFLKVPRGVFTSLNDMGRDHSKNLCILSTGTQGEHGAILPRLAKETLADFQIEKGDHIVLSTRIIPGNEHAIFSMVNDLTKAGAKVFYGAFSDIHSSGHACEEELRLLINLVKPKYFIPIHGEYRHLQRHTEIAQETGVVKQATLAENGDVVTLSSKGLSVKEKVPSGRIGITRNRGEAIPGFALKQRRSLARNGLVAVTLKRDHITDMKYFGIPLTQAAEETLVDLKTYIKADSLGDQNPPATLEESIRRFFKIKTGKKPIVLLFNI